MNITISHKTGRRTGNSKTGHINHVRINGSWKALCGTEPGRRGGWTSYSAFYGDLEGAKDKVDLVTCKRCKKKLKEL